MRYLILASLLLASNVSAQVICIENPEACADVAPSDFDIKPTPEPQRPVSPAPELQGPVSPAPVIDGYGNELPEIKGLPSLSFATNDMLQGYHDDAASEGLEKRGYQHYLACWNHLGQAEQHYDACKANLVAHQAALRACQAR